MRGGANPRKTIQWGLGEATYPDFYGNMGNMEIDQRKINKPSGRSSDEAKGTKGIHQGSDEEIGNATRFIGGWNVKLLFGPSGRMSGYRFRSCDGTDRRLLLTRCARLHRRGGV